MTIDARGCFKLALIKNNRHVTREHGNEAVKMS